MENSENRRIAEFQKVDEEQFVKDFLSTFPDETKESAAAAYESIILPKRATKGSAGYDIRTTKSFSLAPGGSIKIPTGLRVKMREDWALFVFPRSGLGFKFRFQLDNTVGVIDSDYYFSDNQGHIFVKMTNDSRDGKTVSLTQGDAFAQGIFLQYGVTVDDDTTDSRNGGFGSTDRR